MGLIYSNARLLLAARREGLPFQNVATLGRQQFFVTRGELDSLANEFEAQSQELQRLAIGWGECAEPFFQQCLGSAQVDSIDLSNYQSATLIHDLNQPIDDSLQHRFDAVIDGGTLEHIFNVPVALANCMKMVRVGGSVVLSTMANNHCGHGFYQFSPELFFRVFQPDNGYQIERAILVEHPFPGAEISSRQRCYEVTDPDTVGCRVGLVSSNPILIQVVARRISDTPILETPPQQSDYQQLWNTDQQPPVPPPAAPTSKLRRLAGNLKRSIGQRLPETTKRWLIGRQQRREYSLNNRKFYRPW